MALPKSRRKSKSGVQRQIFSSASAIIFSTLTVFRLMIATNSGPSRNIRPLNTATILEQFKGDQSRLWKGQTSVLPHVHDFSGARNQQRKVPLPTKQSPFGGAFVHVGKTGGSALSVLLRNGCHSFLPHPCRNVTSESIASQKIQSYYHLPDFNFLPQSHHDFYLLTLRDPMDRAISAFTFEHIANKRARGEGIEPVKIRKLEFAYQCFPTLEVFVSFLEGNATDFNYPYHPSIIRKPCKDLARAALFGVVRPFNHFFFNYAHVYSLLPNPGELTYYVTRQEHLYEDWVRINQELGQEKVILPAQVDLKQVRNVTKIVVPVTRDLSNHGTLTLCKALESEYKLYFWFLKMARNIHDEDLQASLDRAIGKCPNLPFYSYI